MSIVFGVFLALFVPLLFLGIIYKSDFYQTGQFYVILKCLLWGGITVAPATFIFNILESLGLNNSGAIDHFAAPIYEEILKGFILLYLYRRAKFTYSVDGALYGFAIGTGFAVVESFSYIFDAQSGALIVAIQRVFSANLVHALSSASIGITLGLFRSRTSRFRWHVPAIGFLLAIGQHMLYNNVLHLIDTSNNKIPLGVIFVPGLPGILFIRYVMQRGVRETQNWIKEKLGTDDRVTYNEVTAINRLTDPEDALFPVAERFGIEKARMVEKLLNLQARIGIKRKALDGFGKNAKIRNAVEAEVTQMRTDMENVQREIGTYAMLFVRGLFTEEMISVWEQMQAKIRERSAATEGQKGGGVWLSLEERVKSTMADEEST